MRKNCKSQDYDSTFTLGLRLPFALDSQATGQKQYPEFSACHVVCHHHNDLCHPARMDRRARMAFLSGLGYNFKIPTVFQQGQEKSLFSRDVLCFPEVDFIAILDYCKEAFYIFSPSS